MKKLLIAAVLIAAAIGILIYGIRTSPVPVEVVAVKRKDIPISINVSGSLSFSKKIDIYPKVSGTVSEVRVKVGDKVKKGDTLVIIDAQELKQQMEQIRNIIDLLKITSAMGSLNMNYIQNIPISPDQIKTLETTYNTLNKLYQERIIKSPIDGIVAKVNTMPGVHLQTGQDISSQTSLGNLSNILSLFNLSTSNSSIITIIDPKSLVATVKVDESNILKIKEGQEVEVNVDALEENPWEGKVSSISMIPTLNKDGTYAYDVIVPLPQLGNKVVEGMSISATISLGTKRNALTIPLNAITFKEGRTYVYIIKDGKAEEKEITLGDMTFNEVEVKNGLQGKELVIISPLEKIKNHSKIKIIEGKS
ncbi:MAG TPA: efflux RND transporter periplasmic adaptor subunit [Dictyoglomaceae bacterium]|nr:efflux RND transporter periplasmic adaptor subunit [Dictyoglomaceae bacterium]HOL39017.1 efflux RND transporter periplasmic adaptor subunit [Dictyoglomaceae bacterium]HPP15807.1 efflux RND transporter periplasmic adaptor subunit [Dictyoglomaceae bacterium]